MYTTISFNESCNTPGRFSQQKMETSSDGCGPFENFTFLNTTRLINPLSYKIVDNNYCKCIKLYWF